MESVTILSAVRKATGHLKERLIKMSAQFLAGCEDEIKMATMRGISSTQGLGHLPRVETDRKSNPLRVHTRLLAKHMI